MKRTNTQFERQMDMDRRIRGAEYPSVQDLIESLLTISPYIETLQ